MCFIFSWHRPLNINIMMSISWRHSGQGKWLTYLRFELVVRRFMSWPMWPAAHISFTLNQTCLHNSSLQWWSNHKRPFEYKWIKVSTHLNPLSLILIHWINFFDFKCQWLKFFLATVDPFFKCSVTTCGWWLLCWLAQIKKKISIVKASFAG